MQCFLCTVKLDGWEPDDDPLREHLAHSTSCAWATSISVTRLADNSDEQEEETRDPLSEELLAARRGTFELGEGWIHEGKRGWECKIAKMVEAGWTFDPSPDAEPDGVTCFYCNLSLDGWEPKDDPFKEHERRSPECAFFALVERYHGGGKGKRKKGRGRPSNASRMSTQSAVSAVSVDEADIMAEDVEESGVAAVEDSIVSTASQATVKGKKKAGRKPAAAAAKGAKGRKRANTVDDDGEEAHQATQYPDLSQSQQSQHVPGGFIESSVIIPAQEEEIAPPPAKAAKRGTRQSKQPVDSSVMEVSQPADAAPKAKRGRKPKAPPQPEPEIEMAMESEAEERRLSEASAQLQDELELSMEHMDDAPDNASTPQPAPPPAEKPKRGVKRTSEGLRKEQQDSSIVVSGLEFPAPPKPAAPAKAKRGRKPSKQAAASQDVVAEEEIVAVADEKVVVDEDEIEVSMVEYPWIDADAVVVAPSESEIEEKPKKSGKTKKAPAKKGKGKKASSARSSKATVTALQPADIDDEEPPEDLERDEMEIEAELARISAEQERAEEFEPSPSHQHHSDKHAQQIRSLQEDLRAEAEAMPEPSVGIANYLATVGKELLPVPSQAEEEGEAEAEEAEAEEGEPAALEEPDHHSTPTPSPSASDKENQPSSSLPRPTTAINTLAPAPPPAPAIWLSPTKTVRIPLAPGTPNRLLASPSRNQLSPSKQQFSRLTSTTPWNPVDLDAILLASPQPTPNTLAQRLAAAAAGGGAPISSPERAMSVEEWVRYRAELGEAALRRRCEEVVTMFEREGGRAVESLGGVGVVG